MRLPSLDDPDRYRGLYIYDFGEWSAVGYTAEEIAVLLEDPKLGSGKVFKIHRAYPNGQMELKGVSADQFNLESGMFFCRNELAPAREDFQRLCTAADEVSPPCRSFVHLADRTDAATSFRYVTALIYPSEFEDEMARWLLDRNYAGGDTVEGGISHVSDFYAQANVVLARRQLWSESSIQSRSANEVLASVRRAVQR